MQKILASLRYSRRFWLWRRCRRLSPQPHLPRTNNLSPTGSCCWWPISPCQNSAMSTSPWILPLLFLTGLCAGFVDSIAGGGGLITLPVLLNAGISPEFALGTNKLQATFGSGSATWHFARAKLIDSKTAWLGVLCTAIGAWLGTACVQ